jgi:hypothetical protein
MSVRSSSYLEKDTIESVDLPKTLVLVNNFVFNTMEFLNNMSETCEIKIAAISARINDLETLASVLEAKLESIPESSLKSSAAPKPATAPPPPSGEAPPQGSPAPPPPPPPSQGATNGEAPAAAAPGTPLPDGEAAAQGAEEANVEEELPGVAAKDHPDYAQFFKLQRLRVPMPVLEQKMTAAGLDPKILSTPDARITD